jgi:hypothetical protein
VAQFEFNYDQDVTALVSWSVDPPTLGDVTEGRFRANEVAGPVNGTITATYTFDSMTEVASTGITIIDAQPPPLPDPVLPDKVRYISVAPPTPGPSVALRVRIIYLYQPDPPDLLPGPDFGGWAGDVYWVGQPEICNDPSGLGQFPCAKLDCAPYYSSNWGSQVIHLTGPEIMPSSAYEIRRFPSACQGAEDGCGLGSAALTLHTQRWGDIVAPFQTPGGGRQPNAQDIAAGVDKLRDLPGSLPIPRAQLQPAVLDSTSGVSVLDVAVIVDAVKGAPYPLDGPCLCPPFSSCPIVDACGRCFAP